MRPLIPVLLSILAFGAAGLPAQDMLLWGSVDTSQLGPTGNGSVQIVYTSTIPIFAFQFDITGPPGFAVTGASGGDAGAYGLTVTTGVLACGCGVLGLTFFGPEIPPGSGILTNLSFTGTIGDVICLGVASSGSGFFSMAQQTVVPTVPGCLTLMPSPAASYPGTGEDFTLATAAGLTGFTTGPGFDVKAIPGGNFLGVMFQSPGGTFDLMPPLLLADSFPTLGMPPMGIIAGLHVNISTTVILVDGLTPNPLGLSPVIVPGGNQYWYLLPPGLAGTSLIIQAGALSPSASNGLVALASAHEIQIL